MTSGHADTTAGVWAGVKCVHSHQRQSLNEVMSIDIDGAQKHDQ